MINTPRVIAACTILSLAVLGGCHRGKPASRAPTPAPATEPATTRPTADDAALVDRVLALAVQLDEPESPAREVVNMTRSGMGAYLLSKLKGDGPLTFEDLEQARGSARKILYQLEASSRITVPPPATIKRARGTLKIDGRLEEEDWRRADVIPVNQPRADVPAPATSLAVADAATARMLWDDQSLYVAFEVPDSDIVAPLLPRDGPVFMHDCVELFILSDREGLRYWEIEVSPTGSILDMLGRKSPKSWGGELDGKRTVEGMAEARTVRGTPNIKGDADQGYTVEIAIPFRQLPGWEAGPKPDATLHVLLGRVDRGSDSPDPLYFAHVPWPAWFHNVWAYQPMMLGSD